MITRAKIMSTMGFSHGNREGDTSRAPRLLLRTLPSGRQRQELNFKVSVIYIKVKR